MAFFDWAWKTKKPKRKSPDFVDWERPGHTGTGGESLPETDAEAFLNGERELHFSSTCVVFAKYYPAEKKLLVGFLKNSNAGIYTQVDRGDARSFLDADSKGKWIWNNLRERGTIHKHIHPHEYERLMRGGDLDMSEMTDKEIREREEEDKEYPRRY